MIIGVCGFGSTGSSAVSDYLAEYREMQVIDNMEFTFVSDTDSLIDLEYHVMHPHKNYYDSEMAFYRFEKMIKRNAILYSKSGHIKKERFYKLANDFISDIAMVSWHNYLLDADGKYIAYFKDALFRRRIIQWIEQKIGRRINCYPMKKVYLSVNPTNFYDSAKKYVKAIMQEMGADFSKNIVLDQPFAGNNPQASFPFFEDPYAIVVDRDPRDNYVFAKTVLSGRNHYIPLDSVEDYVKYYRALRMNQPYQENNERILRIRFEDMVFNYEETVAKINKFLNLPVNPAPKTIFIPDNSKANTRVYERFPEYSEEIKYIEKNLSEYLYDFDKYKEITSSGKMFFGRVHQN